MIPQRGFVQILIGDRERLERLFQAAGNVGMLPPSSAAFLMANSRTPSEKLRHLIDHIHPMSGLASTGTDLGHLTEIVRSEHAIRSSLLRIDTWRHIFKRLGTTYRLPKSVELIHPGGRCNFTYRLHADSETYVVRYHDPLGREFLQRYDPEIAVRIYLAAERLFTLCLGEGNVIETLYPSLSLSSLGIVYEDCEAEVADVVKSRILVQRDYSTDYFLMADYHKESNAPSQTALISLFCRPLATLHARSRKLDSRSTDSSSDDILAKEYRAYSPWRRFASPAEYGNWLRGANWVSRATLAALEGKSNSVPEPWQAILNTLQIQPSELIDRCHYQWEHSQIEMKEAGALAHFDHNPRNCFIDRATRKRVCIFDFDYVSTSDPAYDFGISLRALLRLIMGNQKSALEYTTASVARQFSSAYCGYYRELAEGSSAVEQIASRGRQFAALAMAVTYTEFSGSISPDEYGKACATLLGG